jgi:hypothetical protein
MKKLLAYIALTVLVSAFLSAQQKVIQLYDGPPPGSESWNWNEAENDNNSWQTKVVYNVTKPTLTVFVPEADKANGTAVIIAPAEDFMLCQLIGEGLDVAKWLVNKGNNLFCFKIQISSCAFE